MLTSDAYGTIANQIMDNSLYKSQMVMKEHAQ